MKPDRRSKTLLAITRSRAKMYEYDISEDFHIKLKEDPSKLFDLTIGVLGELSANSDRIDVNNAEYLSELKSSLQFSSYFFDAYLSSKLNSGLDQYLLILGSAAYYLCDLPGSSMVLIDRLNKNNLNLESGDLEIFIHWLLKRDFSSSILSKDPLYGDSITQLSETIKSFFIAGNSEDVIERYAKRLRKIAYNSGTPRELLFSDIAIALICKRIENSSWKCLQKYTDIKIDDWLPSLEKETFIKEFWPAQKLLGENEIYKGKSTLVQMFTSAGKTRAAEIIIRSAFLSGRTSVAVIVAPYRALCHEIQDTLSRNFNNESIKVKEISDVLQNDFNIQQLLGFQQVIVVTPEKLNYILRLEPEFANHIKLIIYDEGQLFDDISRGVTYELLLSSLKSKLPDNAQTVLLSAVISNAEDISQWLLQGNKQVVTGTSLAPTLRTVAFASWKDTLGRLEFMQSEQLDQNDFFVPRVISPLKLKRRSRERKVRVFPEKKGNDVALYLGLKLVQNGSVAIFTGRKDSASNLCDEIVEKYRRTLDISPPNKVSDSDEIKCLTYLLRRNFGEDASETQAALLGIYMHHRNIPHGIRLSIEHALQESLIRFVICTSTLAQGVNLPLRYLIIINARLGRERIKTRDFHNLIGRTGRSGMHTEGSVIFSNPDIYDLRYDSTRNWKWKEALQLLKPENSELCSSYILKLFDPLHSDDKRYYSTFEPIELIKAYIKNQLQNLPDEISNKHKSKGFSANGIRTQISLKLRTISAIESYLMANLHNEITTTEERNHEIDSLVEETLAFFQANEQQKEILKNAFNILASHVISLEPDSNKRKYFSNTLFGINKCIDIETWIKQNLKKLESCDSSELLLDLMWPLLKTYIDNSTFKRCSSEEALKNIAIGWIEGRMFYELFKELEGKRIGNRIPKIGHVVDICENALGFEGSMIIGAYNQILEFIYQEKHNPTIEKLEELQKRLKYGLPFPHTTVIYELGFSDRSLSMELSNIVNNVQPIKNFILKEMRRNYKRILGILENYPAYFRMKWKLLQSD